VTPVIAIRPLYMEVPFASIEALLSSQKWARLFCANLKLPAPRLAVVFPRQAIERDVFMCLISSCYISDALCHGVVARNTTTTTLRIMPGTYAPQCGACDAFNPTGFLSRSSFTGSC
jgi:hypothetical protein